MEYLKNKKYTILSKILSYSFVFVTILVLTFSFICTNSKVEAEDVVINATINNPIDPGLQDLPTFITKAIEIILIVGIPVIALAIMYSGFLFITAQGDSKKLEVAKRNFGYILIGALLMLGAFVISKAIVNTVEEIKSTT